VLPDGTKALLLMKTACATNYSMLQTI